MNSYIPNLESVIHTIYLNNTRPIEDYKEIVKNILTIQFEDFVRKKREL